jgi:heat shock protein HslJ
MKTIKIAIVMYIVIMILTACGGTGTEEISLEGTEWALKYYNKNAPLEGNIPTLRFENGEVSGNASCNHFGGSYEISGDKISFGAMFMTEMWCEPEALMDQEAAYLDLLATAERFEIVDGMLTIYAGPQRTLSFVPVGE